MSEGFGFSNDKCIEFFCLNKSKRTSVLLGQVKITELWIKHKSFKLRAKIVRRGCWNCILRVGRNLVPQVFNVFQTGQTNFELRVKIFFGRIVKIEFWVCRETLWFSKKT